ncbi:radical SAM family heme chaperone HemW [Pseudoponticoccus marisrubri]|uniref:Heme chaperone HemW n=1 Tax=Pseudoponticoccus marisrubri TaxID=1685382 RepID=A0A0W7WG76_9RHOB|nr:radical SAM family heme chaperone HemW [Pseudoponticoccus marisrubri]KUF09632.1 coproporphyrinogen III oxidase [Pseudoponticoccus marisrubri]
METWQRAGFGLYVHWPFCAAKCPYCDFNSHVVGRVDQARWAEAFRAEIARAGAETPGRILSSIYFGGGTPSLMEVDTVAAVLDTARDTWTFANDIEITLEANPGSVEAARFHGYRAAGVNRVSLGVQALRAPDLRRLGRLHSVEDARRALGLAREVFDRVSFDLIYARQGQSLEDWRAELSEALEMAGDHLSLYQLTVEPGTAFWTRAQAGGFRGLPGEDLAAEMYELTQELCNAAGLPAYEVSNHARPGSESRHNLIYWHAGDWAGIGPGAHGRLGSGAQRVATETALAPTAWLAAAEAGDGISRRTSLSPQDQAGEYIMMGLRSFDGIEIDRARAMWDAALPDDKLADLVGDGLLVLEGATVRTTPRGRLVLNGVIRELMA